MYYYLHELKSYDIRIIGLDLKTDVIRKCNELAKKYQYDKLTFLEGNIADYTGAEEVEDVYKRQCLRRSSVRPELQKMTWFWRLDRESVP